jgi:hypothetical protein
VKYLFGFLLLLFSVANHAEVITCDQLAALRSDNPGADWRDKLTANLFGKPLFSYTMVELNAIKSQLKKCEQGASSDKNLMQYMASEQMLDSLMEIDKREINRQADSLTQESAQREADARRKEMLSGKTKISNIKDAIIYTQVKKSLYDIMRQPLLSPDKGLYAGGITIDGQDSKYIRGKIEFTFGRQQYLYYVYLKTTKKTINFNSESMRLGAEIAVIGHYISNANYKTLSGETKMAPVIECEYIGNTN